MRKASRRATNLQRVLLASAVLVVLAGCSQSTDSYGTTGQASEPAAAVVTDVATGLSAPPTPPVPSAYPMPSGGAADAAEDRYEITEGDGANLLVTIGADNRFSVTRDGRPVAQGTVERSADGAICGRYTNGARQCFMLGTPAADGSFTVRADNGATMRGHRLDPAPAQATAPRTS